MNLKIIPNKFIKEFTISPTIKYINEGKSISNNIGDTIINIDGSPYVDRIFFNNDLIHCEFCNKDFYKNQKLMHFRSRKHRRNSNMVNIK